jgi:hypothetical protein
VNRACGPISNQGKNDASNDKRGIGFAVGVLLLEGVLKLVVPLIWRFGVRIPYDDNLVANRTLARYD